jgi:predicted secreted hydrolase
MSEQLTFQLQFCNFFPHLSEVARDSGRSETGISLTSSNHQDQRIWVDDWAVENAAGLLKGRNGEAETENQELRNAATSEEPRTVADMKRQELHSARHAIRSFC